MLQWLLHVQLLLKKLQNKNPTHNEIKDFYGTLEPCYSLAFVIRAFQGFLITFPISRKGDFLLFLGQNFTRTLQEKITGPKSDIF